MSVPSVFTQNNLQAPFCWLYTSVRMKDFSLIFLNASLLIASLMGLILRIDTN